MLSDRRFRGDVVVGLLFCISVLFAFGCSEDPTTVATPVASFQGVSSVPDVLSVAMSESAASGPTVTVSVDVAGVSDLYGASFGLNYDSVGWTFVSWSPGSALEQGGAQVTYNAVDNGTGKLTIGASRFATVEGATIGDRLPLVLLTFHGNTRSASPLTFESPVLFDASAPPQGISGVSWFGGTLVLE